MSWGDRRISPEDRLWRKVIKTDTCWLWTGAKTKAKGGYGRLGYRGRDVCAHRLAWILANGPIPDGLCVLHSCDVSLCVRPDHLFLGTQLENIEDRNKKGRTARGDRAGARTHPERLARGTRSGWYTHPESRVVLRGQDHKGSKLTDDQVKEIRAARLAGESIIGLARRYGVYYTAISKIVNRQTWRHLP